MKSLKRYLWIVIVVVVIAAAVCIFPLRHNIDITLNGIQCRIGDTEYTEEKSVSIKGIYNQYLFRGDIFKGAIEVDGYSFTFDEALSVYIDFSKSSSLYYSGNKNGVPVIERLGTLFTKPDFSQILIHVYESTDSYSKGWTSENGLFISAPADTREQAVDIAGKLDSSVTWK